jgi:hypothetical protein
MVKEKDERRCCDAGAVSKILSTQRYGETELHRVLDASFSLSLCNSKPLYLCVEILHF